MSRRCATGLPKDVPLGSPVAQDPLPPRQRSHQACHDLASSEEQP